MRPVLCVLLFREGAAVEQSPNYRTSVFDRRSRGSRGSGRSILQRTAYISVPSRKGKHALWSSPVTPSREPNPQHPSSWPSSYDLKSMCLSLEHYQPSARPSKKPATVPIVMVTVQDPVAIGLIDSLARPRRKYHWGLPRLTRRIQWKEAAVAYRGGSDDIACRSSLGCER